MSYFKTWNEKFEDTSDQGSFNDFVNHYYEMEQQAYIEILENYPSEWKGRAADLAERLKFDGDMIVFTGFLDGIQNSINNSLELEELNDDTEVLLDIDYEKLLYNMHDAGAKWLFSLNAWDNVFDEEKREEIGKKYRKEHIAVSNKVGRNEPCPCGSGKKYKNCHGKAV